MKHNILLASKSPRRQNILRELGFQFETIQLYAEESYSDKLIPRMVASFLAEKKSNSYNKALNEGDILITADTVVIHKNKILGKPESENEAFKMLRSLSGDRHEVVTAVCLRTQSQLINFSDLSEVYFSEIDDESIIYYINKHKPFDKAGSYGIQEWIGMSHVKSIKGSYTNIVGMPSEKTYKYLKVLTK